MNNGERDELLAKLALIRWREDKLYGIHSVGLGNIYISHSKTIADLKIMSNVDILNLCNNCCIGKAIPSQKSDVHINGIGYSLKSNRSAPPAFINHTHRNGILKVCQREGIDIRKLDVLVKNYWLARNTGTITEDVKFKGSVFESDRDVMVKLLAYFLFKGTAKGDSLYPAEFLYSFDDPLDFSTWKKYSPFDAANKIIDNTIISLRNKGMPITYSPNSTNQTHIEMRPWVGFINGEYKGSIHIRG